MSEFLDVLKKRTKDPGLKTALEAVEEIPNSELYSQDVLMKIAYTQILNFLEHRGGEKGLSIDDSRHLSTLLDQARKTQETAIHRQQSVTYSSDNVKKFIEILFFQILGVLQARDVSEKVIDEIIDAIKKTSYTAFEGENIVDAEIVPDEPMRGITGGLPDVDPEVNTTEMGYISGGVIPE